MCIQIYNCIGFCSERSLLDNSGSYRSSRIHRWQHEGLAAHRSDSSTKDQGVDVAIKPLRERNGTQLSQVHCWSLLLHCTAAPNVAASCPPNYYNIASLRPCEDGDSALLRRRSCSSAAAFLAAHTCPLTASSQCCLYTLPKTVARRNASLECLFNPTVRQAVRPPVALPAAVAAGSPGETPPAVPATSPAACRRRRWPSRLPRLPPPAA